jgi:hypothetical protein
MLCQTSHLQVASRFTAVSTGHTLPFDALRIKAGFDAAETGGGFCGNQDGGQHHYLM